MSELTSPGAALSSGAVLVVPVGATEQHGPHLPLTTDTEIAVALASGLAARVAFFSSEDTDVDFVVAPSVPYGSSGEHQGFPGTLSIGNVVIEQLLVELCRSATLTWSRVLLLCAHGGNFVPLSRAVSQLRSEGRDVRAWSPSWGGDAHAGHTETSVMLCLDAARVDQGRFAPGALKPVSELLAAMRAGGVAAVSPNGVLGDPTGASAEHGRALIDAAVEELLAFVAGWPAVTAGSASASEQVFDELLPSTVYMARSRGEVRAGEASAGAAREFVESGELKRSRVHTEPNRADVRAGEAFG